MSDAVLEKDMAAYWDRAGKVWVEQWKKENKARL